jgi:hypothetical protein
MTPIPKNIDPKIWAYTNAVCNGSITPEEMAELERLLKADAVAQDFFIDFLNINAEVLWLFSAKQHSAMDSDPHRTVNAPIAPRSALTGFLGDWMDFINHYSPFSYSLILIFVGAILMTGVYLIKIQNTVLVEAEPVLVAQITAAKNCQWSMGTKAPAEMSELEIGRQLNLEKGLVEITYANKAQVVIEGPVSFTLDSPKSGRLKQGKLFARANTEQSRQFTIITPNAKYVDLGTEFGVQVDAQERSSVAVFSGKVNASAKRANGSWDTPISVKKGEAVICEGVKFTQSVADRSKFPSMQLSPPSAPDTHFQRWYDAALEIQKNKDLVAYYDFQPAPNNPHVLLNRAPTGAMFNGEIKNASWVDGRFKGKKALEFMDNDAGVKVNFPSEYPQVTLIAWINISKFTNNYSGVLLSDGWTNNKLHWQLKSSSQMIVDVAQDATLMRSEFCSIKAIPTDSLNQWCMITAVVDVPNQILLYVNGKPFETLKVNPIHPLIIGPATIGGWDHGDYSDPDEIRNLAGLMDELMLFQKVLKAEEIQQIYESGRPDNP